VASREDYSKRGDAPPDQIFAFFDPKPLGSASIGQVHAARLSDGREVVLKVRKPGVDELVKIDLEILVGLVDLVDHGRLVVLKQTGGQNVSQMGQL
jgi:predicted unusual protein kinase regulating ubiquinone biosynthesis (AarF/ABC1/UbiB family)